MTRKRITVIIAAIALLIAGTASYATFAVKPHTAQDNGQSAQVTAPQLTKYEVGPPDAQELLELVNAERAKVGVAPLVIDERLNQSAQVKADDMATNNYFDHVDANGKHGYEYVPDFAPGLCKQAGENIRWVGINDGTSQTAFDGWYKSSPHIAAIHNSDYVLTGIAIAEGLDGFYAKENGFYIVEHFCITR